MSCGHNKRRQDCRICTPSLTCDHGIFRKGCRICTPSVICGHNKRRTNCVICTPSLICGHNIRRPNCVICTPSLICGHNKRRRDCRICTPSSVCDHAILRKGCKICTPSSVCDHAILRKGCKICTPSSVCDHGKRYSNCAICTPRLLCKHEKRSYNCFVCTPSLGCDHNKRHRECIICTPEAFCGHGKLYGNCIECLPAEKLVKMPRICKMCVSKRLSPERAATSSLCAECDKGKPPRMEHIVWDKIKDSVPPPSYRDDRLIGGEACASNKTRPDLCWIAPSFVLHVEIDEHSHDDREPSCENRKLDSANWGFASKLPSLFIRFNPHEYDKRRASLDQRCSVLSYIITNILARIDGKTLDPLRANVIFLFYHSKGAKHIEAARTAHVSINLIDVIE